MAHIWKALVADPKRAVDENLDYIFDDLLTQCGSRLWRSREASCLALADIIQGRKFDQVMSLLLVYLAFSSDCHLNWLNHLIKFMQLSKVEVFQNCLTLTYKLKHKI